MKNKLFTKSAFKIALECPRRLYYAYDKNEYTNQDLDDEFLQSLAEGGYQVGELAKVYYGIWQDTDIDELDYDKALERTRSLFVRTEINIAEAAFRFGNLFVRADIIEKKGNLINLIEVKAKSWNPENDVFIKSDRKGNISTNKEIRPYLYDVAFQKYVVQNALSEQYPDAGYTVKAFLMFADKTKTADVYGLNQIFPVKKNPEGRLCVEPDREALSTISVAEKDRILTAFDVDEICDMIIKSRMQEQKDGSDFMKSPALGKQVSFVDFVNEMACLYCNREPSAIELGAKCFKCPFHKSPNDDSDKKDGYRECWTSAAGFSDRDFTRPQLKDLTAQGFGKRREHLINQKKFFLNQLRMDDVGKTKTSSGYLDFDARRQLQTALSTGRETELPGWMQASVNNGIYLDSKGLAEQMKEWKFPLHFIDFETSAVALPFYRGLRPYEQVAFQFSHHIVELQSNGHYRIRHAGQYLNVEKGKFPNFDFVRELKGQLDKDKGTIFRYSHHENTILRVIYEQLGSSDVQDKEELTQFIDTITHYKTDRAAYVGDRDMVDLAEVVLKYYYHPMMKGSYSIKKVLPAVLNSSDFIKDKYSKPVYGSTEMPSLNITADRPKTWIEFTDDGLIVKDPYHLLPSISSYIDEAPEVNFNEYADSIVANGGAALAAYSKLQFSDLTLQPTLEKALKVYCELDTMAMVFIWEYFYQSCIKR